MNTYVHIDSIITFAVKQAFIRYTIAMTGLEKVREIIEKPLKELGYDIADITFEKEEAYEGRNGLVVYISRPEGITIEDCVKASKKIKPLIDEADPIKEDYIFEVSSTATSLEY